MLYVTMNSDDAKAEPMMPNRGISIKHRMILIAVVTIMMLRKAF